MAEDLVPTGQPYGNRQQNVDAMRAGGMPLASTPTSPRGPAAGGAPPPGGAPLPPMVPNTGLSLLENHSPDEFPFLADPSPASVQTGPTSPIQALAVSAQSTFAQAVLARLNVRR